MPKLHITSTRMLIILEYIIAKGIAHSQEDAAQKIGVNPEELDRIKNGETTFSVDQIEAALNLAGASADFVFGHVNVMSRGEPKKIVDILKEVVFAMESGQDGHG